MFPIKMLNFILSFIKQYGNKQGENIYNK